MTEGVYPHPKKREAWRESRATTEELFWAGRGMDPAECLRRVRAVAVPRDCPAVEEYQSALVAWLESKQ